MNIGIIILVIAVLIAIIWAFMGISQMKQKIFIFLLMALILFVFLSFVVVFKGKDISIKSISDIEDLVKVYFSWISNLFGNVKTVTTNAIKMDWVNNSAT